MTTTFPIGVAIFPPTAQKVLRSIKRAEQAGVPMAWVPTHPVGPDGLAIAMAAAVQTSTIGLGTGIAITYPRHPHQCNDSVYTFYCLARSGRGSKVGTASPTTTDCERPDCTYYGFWQGACDCPCWCCRLCAISHL